MTKIIVHQGDVLVMETPVPSGAKQVETQGPVFLAYGETTGHSHHLVGPRVTHFREDGLGSPSYLRLLDPVPLEHGVVGQPETADHATITLPPGEYEVRRQVEWQDDDEPIRQVED